MDGLLEAAAHELGGSLWPLAAFAVIVLGIVAAIVVLSHFLGERHQARYRNIPFESGIQPTGSAWVRFPVHYFLVALFFLVFDVEVAFIFAWAVAHEELGWLGYAEMVVFVLVLLAGLVYVWRKGGLDWLGSRRAEGLKGIGAKGEKT